MTVFSVHPTWFPSALYFEPRPSGADPWQGWRVGWGPTLIPLFSPHKLLAGGGQVASPGQGSTGSVRVGTRPFLVVGTLADEAPLSLSSPRGGSWGGRG